MEQYIKPFVDVSVDVFKQFIGIEVTAKTPYFSEKDSVAGGDVSAVIGLTGGVRGAVIISMQKELAIKLTNILTGAEYTQVDDDVLDAVGEIVNIIAGNVKQKLEDMLQIIISLPTIVKGNGHTIKWPGNQARILCIPFKAFETDIFNLFVAIEIVQE
jgi:chemotaxis protein CheX